MRDGGTPPTATGAGAPQDTMPVGPGAASAAPVPALSAPRVDPAVPAAPGTQGAMPRLADGIELIGEYEDSGFKEAPWLVRRPDGQTIQLTKLLYAVAERSDGRHDYAAIASEVSQEIGRGVSAENVAELVEKKLRGLGVITGGDGSGPELTRNDPMTALKFRARVVPEGVVAGITTLFRPLYWPPVVLGVLLAIGAFDAWMFFFHGIAQGMRQMLYQPTLMLLALVLVIASAAFHECGHATACRYGGAKPGVMGAGLYMVWPAFYTDVTDAYRLGKGGRLRTDLGGVYFNLIFALVTAGAYFLTHFEPLLVVIAFQHIEILHQFLPFLRMDGYYIVADLTGVPDLFARLKPTLKSLVPGQETEKQVEELKPWVRWAVTAWVLVTIPFILYVYGMIVTQAPRIFATAVASGREQWGHASDSISHGNYAMAALFLLQALLLALPILGVILTIARLAKTIASEMWTRTEGRPVMRTGFVGVASMAVILLVIGWSPRGRYAPIRPDERGTLQAGVDSAATETSSGGVFNTAPESQGPTAPAGAQPAPGAQPGTGSGSGAGNPGSSNSGGAAPVTGGQPAGAATPSPAVAPSASPVTTGASPSPTP
jgi:putative peptide zinc metalloprotease protein